ncbi:TrbI/VirB10 family protein [Salmonella enterica]
MMEEREKKVDEKPATYKKKLQYYAFGTFGVILLILFLNMVWSIVTRNSSEKKAPEQTTTVTTTAPNTTEKFSDLLKNSGARPSVQPGKGDETTGNTTGNTGTTGRVVEERKPTHPYNRDSESRTGGNQRVDPNSPDEVRARFKADEINRALRARSDKTNFDSSKNGGVSAGSGNAYAPAATFTAPDTRSNAQRINSLGQEQNGVLSRIQMMESKVHADEAALPGRIAEAQRLGESRLAAAQRGQAGIPGGMPGDGAGKSSQTLPSGVVGYTASNPYGASVEGMKKLPVGAILNAITTMTAISDYSGGSMKAMLTHDIYDATNSYVLAPKGSEFIIRVVKASQVNEVLQSRMGFKVTWLVLPNGDRVDFSSSSGLDRMGTPAVEGDEVDRHLLAQFLGVAAYALVGTKSSYEGTGDSNESFAGNFGQGARGQAGNIAQKYLQVVPTTTLHAGAPIRVITEDEIFMKPWSSIYETNYAN